jgi:hypothetical protein
VRATHETGVWLVAFMLMRGILKAYDVNDRTVWVADSFEGLPPADRVRYPKESAGISHGGGTCGFA